MCPRFTSRNSNLKWLFAVLYLIGGPLECERPQFTRNGIDRTLCNISCYLDDAKTHFMLYICGSGAFRVTFLVLFTDKALKGPAA